MHSPLFPVPRSPFAVVPRSPFSSLVINRWLRRTAGALAVSTAGFAPLIAQGVTSQPATAAARAAIDATVGVMLVAHGADRGWNAPVESLAAQVRANGFVKGPVGVAFLMGDEAPAHRFQDVAAALVAQGAKHIVVVPLLVSSHSGHYEQIRYLAGATDSLDEDMRMMLHMSGIERASAAGVPIVVTRALDDSPELAAALASRANALAQDRPRRALFLFGHGPNSAEDYAAWMKNLRVVADSVRAATGYASVAVELVRDDAPAEVRAEAVKRAREIIELQHAATHADVVVVPILVSSGTVSQKKLPADLAGLPAIYAGTPLLPDSLLAHWVERRVRDALSP